jgi:thioredoxin reductase
MDRTNVAIIGAGPAGMACAMQLSRYGIIPLIFERDIPGGLLKNANLVENYPVFPGGISGTSLVRKMTKQLELAKVPVIKENVLKISYQADSYRMETKINEYFSKILVVASGTIPNEWADFPLPETIKGKIYYEVYPLRNIRDAVIAIIGAGDAAFDYAIQLGHNNKVMIMNRSDRVKCLPLLWHRAMGLEQISYYENHLLKRITDVPASSCLKLFFETTNEMESIFADYIIFAIGRQPDIRFTDPELLNHLDELKKLGKLFLVGDVKNNQLRQASIAVGDGIKTAMEIYFNESHRKDK